MTISFTSFIKSNVYGMPSLIVHLDAAAADALRLVTWHNGV